MARVGLRRRVLLTVVLVILLPLVWVWVAGLFERGSVVLLRRALARAASRGVAAIDGDLDQVAREARTRLRVISAAGTVVEDHDHTVITMFEPVADPFFGPDGAPDLRQVDAQLPPLPHRAEVRDATATARPTCTVAGAGLMLVCAAALRAPDGRVVHVVRGSPRLVRSLYEERFQLTAMTLVVLAVGVLLAWWLGLHIVSPIEGLRNQVVARTRGPVSTKPVEAERPDEIGDLAHAFNELLAALEDRNNANAAFVADLAHELKNPVAAVRAASEALAADRAVEGERRDRLQRVLADSSARMEAVVDRFLELARAEAGLPGVGREPVNLHTLVAGVVEAFASDARYAEVTFHVDTEPVTVHAASERLETAVRNLVANAAHFALPSGTVDVHLQVSTSEVAVVVRDSGQGIAPDDIARIFDRYVSERQGGTGLGLPLVRAIAQAHGGRVEVDSTAGSGATFTLTLPRSQS